MRLRAVLAGSVALISLAGPAHADPDPDTSFLDALNNAGITYRTGSEAIAIGKRACQLMDQGHPEPDVVKSMSEQNAAFTVDAATKFTQIAASFYCRQHTGGAQTPPQPAPQQPDPWFDISLPPLPAAF